MSLNNVAMIIAPNLFLSSEAKTQPTINEMKQAQATVNIVRMLVKYQMILWTVRLVPFLVLPIFLPLAVRLRYVWLFLFFPLPFFFPFSSLSLPFLFPFSSLSLPFLFAFSSLSLLFIFPPLSDSCFSLGLPPPSPPLSFHLLLVKGEFII